MDEDPDLSGIIPALRPFAVPIDSLKLLPGNPRRGDVEVVARSYAKFGQRKPLVVTSDGTCTAGNHQLKAARDILGWTHIAVVSVDDDAEMAIAWALADNRTHDVGDYDRELLADALKSISDPSLMEATGYDDATVKAIIEEAAPTRGQAQRDLSRATGGNPVIQYQIVFGAEDEQQTWFRFIRWLKRTYDGDTLSERLTSFLSGILPTDEEPPS